MTVEPDTGGWFKSLMASVAFPAWCLGHEPSAQILSVTPGFNGDGPSRV
jgi:hypothetical protein